jgi:class 3 adenylate cyclase
LCLRNATQVETIGDSYFAVSGMLPQRADHARAALRFALDLHAAASATPLPASVIAAGGGSLLSHVVQIRVGLHSGAVTSGVIGHLRARFCLFGDTVRVLLRCHVLCPCAAALHCAALPHHLPPSRTCR